MKQQLKKIFNLIGFRSFLLIVLLLTAFVQFFIMLSAVESDTYDIQITQIAQDTIRAVKTVEDTEKTELLRNEAENLVEPVYVLNSDVAEHRVSFVNSVFDTLIAEKVLIEQSTDILLKSERINALKKSMKEIINSQPDLALSDTQLEAFLTVTVEEIEQTRDAIEDIVQESLSNAIRKEALPTLKIEAEAKVVSAEKVNRTLLNPSIAIVKVAIVETEKLDPVKTEERITQARSSVEPTKILQGQIIIREGEAIDREMIRQMELLSMLDAEGSNKPIIGLIIFILLQMSFMYILFDRSKLELVKKQKGLLVTVSVYIISIIVMSLMNLVAENFDVNIGFLFPTAMATMLVRLLANDKAASVVTILTAASSGIVFQQGYAAVLQMDVALYILFGGFGALYFMRNMEKRAHLLHAVTVISIINILFIAFYLLMSQASLSFGEILFYMTAGIISGLLSGALTMGLLPFFESAFGILSTMRLIELSNPNHPLLKKILMETPGTYHHSVMVANLAEASCEAIGADGLLARVASYYHDVGKSRRPLMFIENQISGVNPHDTLPPEKSAEIIISHTTEGAELLRQHKMPLEIIDIALQHHGTSTLKFFLFKAKEEGENFDEAKFRYPGPKPQSKEAAIISIADSVEAAVRSMKEPTSDKIQHLIRSIIQNRLQDEQFDECDLSIKELKKIEQVLCETLNGIFHSRIEYPK